MATSLIKVTSASVRNLGNVHSDMTGPILELFTNATAYSQDGKPYCDARLIDENDPNKARLVVLSHSFISESSHIFNYGHLDTADKINHRKFNIGMYITAGRVCEKGKEGMIVITFDPNKRRGEVMRAYSENEYMHSISKINIILKDDDTSTIFTDQTDEDEAHRIEKVWKNTLWQVKLRQDQSHDKFCKMMDDTIISHAMKEKKQSTAFIFINLKKVVIDKKNRCFLTKTGDDIMEYDGNENHSFRKTISAHFLPYITGLESHDVRERKFYINGKLVNMACSKSKTASWIQQVGAQIQLRTAKFIQLCDNKVQVKFNYIKEDLEIVCKNYKACSDFTITNNNLIPSGIVMTYYDKVFNSSPFSFHNGECFTNMPDTAIHFRYLVDAFCNKKPINDYDVVRFFQLIGIPNANIENDKKKSQEIRNNQLKKNSKILGIISDSEEHLGYDYMSKLLIKPGRWIRKNNKETLEYDIKSVYTVYPM